MLTSNGIARCDTPKSCVEVQIELYYEDLGDPADPPVLLIMGLGAQLPMWPDGFCAQLVESGHRVIRFDHRDTGVSAKMHGMRAEGSVYPRIWRHLLGRTSRVPYTLIDMTGDVVALDVQRWQADFRAAGRGARFALPHAAATQRPGGGYDHPGRPIAETRTENFALAG